MTDRTCAACAKPIPQKPGESDWNYAKRKTCGKGTPCPVAMRNAAPGYGEKIRDAKLRAFEANPASRERVARAAAKQILCNRGDYSALQRKFAASLTPEQRSAHYGRKRGLAGLNEQEETDYRKLCKAGYTAAEARAMVLEASRAAVLRELRQRRDKDLRDRY